MPEQLVPTILGEYAPLKDKLFSTATKNEIIDVRGLALAARHKSLKQTDVMIPSQLERLVRISSESQDVLLTVVHRSFFRVAKIASVQIKDIINIEASLGPFFGSLVLTSKHFLNNLQTINFLKRGEVVKIQRSIQGLIIAQKEGIDTTNIGREQLIRLVSNLGKGSSN